jgi:hypothetical protein
VVEIEVRISNQSSKEPCWPAQNAATAYAVGSVVLV